MRHSIQYYSLSAILLTLHLMLLSGLLHELRAENGEVQAEGEIPGAASAPVKSEPLRKLVVIGLGRTDTVVVTREFRNHPWGKLEQEPQGATGPLHPDEPIRKPATLHVGDSSGESATSLKDSSQMAEGIRRLRNTGLFASVEGEWEAEEAKITVQEKWTTIPIGKLKGGGGLFTWNAGVYDPNVFGKALELGAQYENFNGKHGGVFWMRKPWFLDKRWKLGMDFWLVRRLDIWWQDGDSLGVTGWERWKANSFLETEMTKSMTLIWGAEYLYDRQGPDVLRPKEQAPAPVTNQESHSVLASVSARYGILNTLVFLQEGFQFEPKLELGTGEEFFVRSSADLRMLWLPWQRLNLGSRIYAAHTNSNYRAHWWRMGGLEQVRGVPDAFVQGSHAWLTNLEGRITAFENPWIVLQTVVFTDAAWAGDSFFPADEPGPWQEAAILTWGGGVRLLSPRIYRLNLRLDYGIRAFSGEKGVSFGLQQFF